MVPALPLPVTMVTMSRGHVYDSLFEDNTMYCNVEHSIERY